MPVWQVHCTPRLSFSNFGVHSKKRNASSNGVMNGRWGRWVGGGGIAMRQSLEFECTVHFRISSAPVVAVYGGSLIAERDGCFWSDVVSLCQMYSARNAKMRRWELVTEAVRLSSRDRRCICLSHALMFPDRLEGGYVQLSVSPFISIMGMYSFPRGSHFINSVVPTGVNLPNRFVILRDHCRCNSCLF